MAESTTQPSAVPRAKRTLPGHDVFSTPENAHFYSRTSYTALDAAAREIRLARVLPDTGRGLIECQLLHNVPLADVQGRYCALSYCAGDARKTDVILVDGVRCNVFANLRHALAEARFFWREKRKGREFLLWVDQVCINQADLTERSHQVGFMRDIYQKAEQVLICLSVSKANGRGMEWLSDLSRKVPAREDDVDLPESGSCAITGDPRQPYRYYRLTDDPLLGIPDRRVHRYRLRDYLWANVGRPRFANGWIAFYDIMESPWWGRAWVFQEFIACPNVAFLYGRQSLSWHGVSHVLTSICCLHLGVIFDAKAFLESTGFKSTGPQFRQLRRVVDRSVTKADTPAALDTVEFMAASKLTWDGSADLKALLAHSRYCQASDSRDRVYAFIGLAAPGYGILPNYSADNKIRDVLVEATQRIIAFEDRINVIAQAPSSLEPRRGLLLPSWVVDWTQREPQNARNQLSSAYDTNGLFATKSPEASFRTIPCPGVPGGVALLEIWALPLDTLDAETSHPPPLVSAAGWAVGRAFKARRLGHTLTCPGSVRGGDQIWCLYGLQSGFAILRRGPHGYRLVSTMLAFREREEDAQCPRIYADLLRLVAAREIQSERITLV